MRATAKDNALIIIPSNYMGRGLFVGNETRNFAVFLRLRPKVQSKNTYDKTRVIRNAHLRLLNVRWLGCRSRREHQNANRKQMRRRTVETTPFLGGGFVHLLYDIRGRSVIRRRPMRRRKFGCKFKPSVPYFPFNFLPRFSNPGSVK